MRHKPSTPATATADIETALVDWPGTDLYRFFARVLGPPTRECFEFMARRSAREALHDLWRHLGCAGDFPDFAWFPIYDLYESTYIALFDAGVPEPAVPLFESAHDKSHPPQQIALENAHFYEVLGLKFEPAKALPDYLITQLEFLAALRFARENTPENANADSLGRAKLEFLDRHLLNWVPHANRKLKETGTPGFSVLMEMLLQFLCNEFHGCTPLAQGEESSRSRCASDLRMKHCTDLG